jgi:hypothetical protein
VCGLGLFPKLNSLSAAILKPNAASGQQLRLLHNDFQPDVGYGDKLGYVD